MFTDPEVAQVGLTEAQTARVRGVRVASIPMRAVRAITAGRAEGFVTLIAAPRWPTGNLGGGRLLGATIVAARAAEMIDPREPFAPALVVPAWGLAGLARALFSVTIYW